MVVVEQPKPKPKLEPKRAKTPRPPKERIDPQLVAKARELRDRYLERLNDSPSALPAPAARYDVSRSLAAPMGQGDSAPPVLPAPLAA